MAGPSLLYHIPAPDAQSALSTPSDPYPPFNEGPVGEEKEDDSANTSSGIDAEQWLTRKPTLSYEADLSKKVLGDKENQTKQVPKIKIEEEPSHADAEQWLTRGSTSRGNRELLNQWKRQHDDVDKYAVVEARSSVSSPGKSSLREKLQHRLQKRNEIIQKRKQLEFEKPESRDMQEQLNHSSMEDILGTWTDLTEPNSPTSPTSDSGLSVPVDSHSKRSHSQDDESNVSLYRLSRTVRYGRMGEVPPRHPKGHANVVRLHVYDLLANNTIMQLPFGCEFPIGKCFQSMNNGLHALGTGAYHCGIEVNGIEYAYGANDIADSTGVFTCVPKRSPGYEYRKTIDFGPRTVLKTSWVNVRTDLVNTKTGEGRKVSDVYEAVDAYLDGSDILKLMAAEYRGLDYDLLEKNCCTFARDACLRLGVHEDEIPTWFMNLPNTGADARDAAQRTLSAFAEPATKQVAFCRGDQIQEEEDGGFEVIAEETRANSVESILVVDTIEGRDQHPDKPYGVRRTLSWTY